MQKDDRAENFRVIEIAQMVSLDANRQLLEDLVRTAADMCDPEDKVLYAACTKLGAAKTAGKVMFGLAALFALLPFAFDPIEKIFFLFAVITAAGACFFYFNDGAFVKLWVVTDNHLIMASKLVAKRYAYDKVKLMPEYTSDIVEFRPGRTDQSIVPFGKLESPNKMRAALDLQSSMHHSKLPRSKQCESDYEP